MLYCKDVAASEIDQYGVTEISVVEGVLYRNGERLSGPGERIRIFASCLSANPLQGLFDKVKLSKCGRISIWIFERGVNKDGYYIDECSDTSLQVNTYRIDENFLQTGWTKEQGNTAGFSIPFPFKNHIRIIALALMLHT